jgi:hypothetical protein
MDDNAWRETAALRTLYEQRACPTDFELVTPRHPEELEVHLGYCRYCNERLELMGNESEQSAWRELAERLTSELPGQPQRTAGRAPTTGEVWSLEDSLGGWGAYSRFYTPPDVLILQVQDGGRTLRVAQVCAEDVLVGNDDGDLPLGNGMGFAESWNLFSVHRDHLKSLRGQAGAATAELVLARSLTSSSAELRPIIKQFRELEIQVGAFVALHALGETMAAVEVSSAIADAEAWLAPQVGELSQALDRIGRCALGWIVRGTGSLLDLFTSAEPATAPGYAGDTPGISMVRINRVSLSREGLLDGSVPATIVRARSDNGTFFILIRLNKATEDNLTFIAQLELDNKVYFYGPLPLEAGCSRFTIKFGYVPAASCTPENAKNKVKILLVKP